MSPSGPVRRSATAAALIAGSALAGALTAWIGAAGYFARMALTPDAQKVDDQVVLEVTADTVLLRATPDAVVPGRYGLWFGVDGHARIGAVVERNVHAGTVRRELVAVDRGVLRPGPARWDQYWFWDAPDISMGLPTEHVELATEVGPMPAWVVPGATAPTEVAAAPGTWAVLLHGRGAMREETLRGVEVLHRRGVTCIVPAYRNDADAPPAPDGRYALGLAEWRDAEAAVSYALERGAGDVILCGWSMGGAVALQLLDRSVLAPRVSRIVLDSPVVSWSEVLIHHAALRGVPSPLARVASALMGEPRARRLVGVHEPVDVASTDWPARAEDLRHPMLLIHSLDDEFVPVGASRRLAAARPDLVRFVPWHLARHVKEWNVDPERWDRVVGDWITADRADLVPATATSTVGVSG